MIILLEGPDGTGKTTLAKAFESAGFLYLHFSKMQDVEADYAKIVEKLETLKKDNVNCVIDRLFVSNWVYQTVYKDGSIVSNKTVRKVVDLLDTIIFCLPSIENDKKYLKNFKKLKNTRQEDYPEMEGVLKGFRTYYEFFTVYNSRAVRNTEKAVNSNLDIFNFDMFSHPKNTLVNYVIAVIGAYNARSVLFKE